MGSVKLNKNEELKSILEDEQIRLNVILVLMEIKPYRKSILTQILNSKHELHKNWGKMTFEYKSEWIKDNMFKKWSKLEFIEHILNSIKLLSHNKNMKFSFEIALGVDKL